METSITLNSMRLQSFSKNWSNFYINQIKGRLVKRQMNIQHSLLDTSGTTIKPNTVHVSRFCEKISGLLGFIVKIFQVSTVLLLLLAAG